ncbi:hypothetical protein [Halorussus lipolyticus]|uniref:hypothetical protein n=1 Tax=Halorussus lipolyticus TaxID=3034024 RepID=UPI0023E7FFFE|nr:hypothetical protein [Halorussus sp. DT80]
MAPFEWLTPDRTMKSLSLFAGLNFLGMGVVNVYLGLASPAEFDLFGTDVLLVIGGF